MGMKNTTKKQNENMNQEAISHIKVFSLGGSIDKTYSLRESDFVVGDAEVKNILKEANTDIEFEFEEFMRVDSLEICPEDRETLLERVKQESCRHILITHGTDSMIQTGLVLKEIKDKVIVLTGAMRPAAFKDSDAAFNIGSALTALQTMPVGVYLVMNGRIFDPGKVKKNMDSRRFEEF